MTTILNASAATLSIGSIASAATGWLARRIAHDFLETGKKRLTSGKGRRASRAACVKSSSALPGSNAEGGGFQLVSRLPHRQPPRLTATPSRLAENGRRVNVMWVTPLGELTDSMAKRSS